MRLLRGAACSTTSAWSGVSARKVRRVMGSLLKVPPPYRRSRRTTRNYSRTQRRGGQRSGERGRRRGGSQPGQVLAVCFLNLAVLFFGQAGPQGGGRDGGRRGRKPLTRWSPYQGG